MTAYDPARIAAIRQRLDEVSPPAKKWRVRVPATIEITQTVIAEDEDTAIEAAIGGVTYTLLRIANRDVSSSPADLRWDAATVEADQ